MAFFLTLLYILTAFVSPPVLFGEFHQYHVEIIIAVLALLSSIPSLAGSGFLQLPQTLALFVLWVIIVISVSINASFTDGAMALYYFVPVTFPYFLTALNCKTKRHLQLIFLAMFLGSLYFIIHGYLDLKNNVTPSLYLYGEGLRRLRGLGLVNDPNDFSQVMVSLVPCFYLFRTKTAIANLFTVVLPIAVLVTGLYLAHSRGAAIGLMTIVILTARRKIGTVPALVVGGILFAGSLAFGWSGGREVSMEAGADRLDAWLVGIEFIKAHPLFGIGNNRFGELNYITAHNSVVVCAAEDGILGFVCWIMFVFSNMRMGVRVGSVTTDEKSAPASAAQLDEKPENAWAKMLARSKQDTAEQPKALETPAQPALPSLQTTEDAATLKASVDEVQTMARMIVLALTGFLTAGWFLSRALSPWMFMYCGMLVAVQRMAKERGFPVSQEPTKFLFQRAVAIAAGLLVLLYVTLKIRAVTG